MTKLTQNLLFYIAGPSNEKMKRDLKRIAKNLANNTKWLIKAPDFVNESEKATKPGDLDIETVGLLLNIYSAYPPSIITFEEDKKCFEEVNLILNHISEYSTKNSLSFELELDGVFVGSINNGVFDNTLKKGLLEPWEQALSNQ